jgi:hypothetical protein
MIILVIPANRYVAQAEQLNIPQLQFRLLEELTNIQPNTLQMKLKHVTADV